MVTTSLRLFKNPFSHFLSFNLLFMFYLNRNFTSLTTRLEESSTSRNTPIQTAGVITRPFQEKPSPPYTQRCRYTLISPIDFWGLFHSSLCEKQPFLSQYDDYFRHTVLFFTHLANAQTEPDGNLCSLLIC